MTYPPSSNPASLRSCLTDFGRELRAAAGSAEILELLLRQAAAAWQPSECGTRWAGPPVVVRARPHLSPDLDAALELAARRGPILLSGDLADECRQAGIEPPSNNTAAAWLLVPLANGDRPAGGLAIRSSPGAFGDADLLGAQALAELAALALGRLCAPSRPTEPPWQGILDAIPSALCVVDESGSIRRANQAFASLVGAGADGLIGRPWRLLVLADWVAELDRLIGAGDPDRRADLDRGDELYVATAARVAAAGPEIVLLFTEQTARRRLQSQLVQAEKMSAIGQLIAGVAHDLNNPLASVVGFAEFLSERPEVPASLQEPVSIIREEAERASSIVKNLLRFVRKQERQRRATPLQPLLDATLALLGNALAASRVEARLEIEPDLPLPVVDPNQIQQVLVNLIHNAIQAIAATGKPGLVILRARRWREGVSLAVADNGPGMSERVAAQVFKPFFTTKPEGQGTGLGLSIAQGIVHEHGGRITLEATEGVGSTFTVYLPGGEETGPLAAAGGSGAAAPGLRILVVDDEPHILHYMRATLESWGHTVAEAADGEEACDRLVRDCFDLVVADLRMPRLGGRELYERLNRERPSLAQRVVFATGDTVRGDTLAFLKSVGRPYLRKPFSLSELRTLLAGVSKVPPG
jgi:two-component system NtrC family sensor kinase